MWSIIKNVAVLFVGFLIGTVLIGVFQIGLGEAPASQVSMPTEAIAPQALLDHADECWTGSDNAPKAALPSAAIVIVDGEAVYTDSPKMVDSAFSSALGLAKTDLVVVALCK